MTLLFLALLKLSRPGTKSRSLSAATKQMVTLKATVYQEILKTKYFLYHKSSIYKRKTTVTLKNISCNKHSRKINQGYEGTQSSFDTIVLTNIFQAAEKHALRERWYKITWQKKPQNQPIISVCSLSQCAGRGDISPSFNIKAEQAVLFDRYQTVKGVCVVRPREGAKGSQYCSKPVGQHPEEWWDQKQLVFLLAPPSAKTGQGRKQLLEYHLALLPATVLAAGRVGFLRWCMVLANESWRLYPVKSTQNQKSLRPSCP